MALIKCSCCEKDISDKAASCPHCGHPVELQKGGEVKSIFCGECGVEVPQGMEACLNCGCPVENDVETPQKVEVTGVSLPKRKKNKKLFVIIAIVVVVLLGAGLIVGNIIHQKKLAEEARMKEEYLEKLELASYTMLVGAAEAEDAGNLIKSVWFNSIYEESDPTTDKYTRPNGYFYDDFNDALSLLFFDDDFIVQLDTIEANQEEVAKLMKDLKNPPEEYEDAYDALKKYYEAYTNLTNLAINPSGSLTTFSENFNTADTEVLNCYNTMQLYIED